MNMKKLLDGFDSLIEDTEKEKVRQLIVLQSVASLIDSAEDFSAKPKREDKVVQTEPFSLEMINCESSYDEYLKTFGTSFGDIGSIDSINAFVSLIKRDLEPKTGKRTSLKKKRLTKP
jgi:phage-related tail protein